MYRGRNQNNVSNEKTLFNFEMILVVFLAIANAGCDVEGCIDKMGSDAVFVILQSEKFCLLHKLILVSLEKNRKKEVWWNISLIAERFQKFLLQEDLVKLISLVPNAHHIKCTLICNMLTELHQD